MPPLCCVPLCRSRRGGHKFPHDPDIRLCWVQAVQRTSATGGPWEPKPYMLVCKVHFTPDDYITETYHGTTPLNRTLKKGAVPSVFAWSDKASTTDREKRMKQQSVDEVQVDDTALTVGIQEVETDFKMDDMYSHVSVKQEPAEDYGCETVETNHSVGIIKQECSRNQEINHNTIYHHETAVQNQPVKGEIQLFFGDTIVEDIHTLQKTSPNTIELKMECYSIDDDPNCNHRILGEFQCAMSEEKSSLEGDGKSKPLNGIVHARCEQTICDDTETFIFNKTTGTLISERTTSEKKPNNWSVCKKPISQSYGLVEHTKTHPVEKPYGCSLCEKSFAESDSLAEHVNIHMPPNNNKIQTKKLYTCTFCEKSFLLSSCLNQHIRKHTGEKPYSCTFCEKAFSSSANRTKHMRIHTGEKPYSCSVCKKSFSQNHIIQHMRVHTGERPFSCAICGQRFTQRSNLMKKHTGEKQHTCYICGKSFYQGITLEQHMRLHTGERPYSCTVCEKSFSCKGVLVTHTRTHTGEKPYSCTVCEKSFSCKGALVTHTRTHTGEKPYSCTVCEKSFSTTSKRAVHMRIHT